MDVRSFNMTNDDISLESIGDMLYLFIQTCPKLQHFKLTKSQTNILHAILLDHVQEKNICTFNAEVKSDIANKYKIKLTTIEHYIRTFLRDGILIQLKTIEAGERLTYLNPDIFGISEWKNRESVIYLTRSVYDFKQMQYAKNVYVEK